MQTYNGILNVFRYEDSEESVSSNKYPTIFLAGPTVRGNQPHLTSWRFEAIELLKQKKFCGSVIVPEFSQKNESDKGKKWIPLWEFNGLKRADVILFWIPRTRELIGLTTNWEHGFWLGRQMGKVIYGRLDNSYRIDYLDIMWETLQTNPIPPYNTLEKTIDAAIQQISKNIHIDIIDKELISSLKFPHTESLFNMPEEIKNRMSSLEKALKLGNNEQHKIKIIFEDDTNKKQVETTVWGLTDKQVILKQGISIPIHRIIEVKI